LIDHLEYLREIGVREIRRPSSRARAAATEGDAQAGPGLAAPHAAPKISKASALESLLGEQIGDCRRCRLCESRSRIVFGVGDPEARLMFVGEGPGRDEDIQGIPFVGRAGQLLTDIIRAMELTREAVYIANIIKCRPPENRTPEPDEIEACRGFLERQIEIISPAVVVCLGAVATHTLLGTSAGITKIRGQLREYRGIPLMPTYHPAFLLRSPNKKREVWQDMKVVMSMLEG
jgi:DNA polymerase